MCNGKMHAFLQALPKCEHHMHLEGALTPSLVFRLASTNAITLPLNDPAFHSPTTLSERYQSFTSLDDFLHYYYIGMSCLITAADFESLAWDYFTHAQRDGVVHTEVFFDPQAHLARGVEYETVLEGFQRARSRAWREWGISSELICCFLRHLAPSDSLTTFRLPALRQSLLNHTVAAIGLDSSELPFPPSRFKDLFIEARDLGINRTAHAGEEGPATYIASALDDLHVTRIDHGLKLASDPALLQRVAETKTLLTLCPWSNLLLRCVDSIAELPIRQFLDAGVRFSINSDDPAYFGNHYILDNYCAVQEAFQLSVEEWSGICEAGIEGSWCGEERKEELLAKLERVVEEWKGVLLEGK